MRRAEGVESLRAKFSSVAVHHAFSATTMAPIDWQAQNEIVTHADGDAVAFVDARVEQGAGQRRDLAEMLGVSDRLVLVDQERAVAERPGGLEHLPERSRYVLVDADRPAQGRIDREFERPAGRKFGDNLFSCRH